ncbi:MAG: cyclic nucleotide-binding domain-containing protein [Myxococcales bacterium]|jgi:CRP/FNR family cyclic AMP-dependent transcriptional regulator
MQTIEGIVREHPFFQGLDEASSALIAGCARNAVFHAGAHLFREGDAADSFFLLRHGKVALEFNAPGREPLTFATLNEGEILGAAWLIPPYRWSYDARAVELTRAVALDGKCLREKAEADHDLGYELMKRFVPILARRLQETRLQLLDVYGQPRNDGGRP